MDCKSFKLSDSRCVVVIEYSKIGYSYPRLLVETDTEVLNIDCVLGMTTRMHEEAFEEYWNIAEPIEGIEIVNTCESIHVNFDALHDLCKMMAG